MQQPISTGARPPVAPSFYLTGRQTLGPGALLLAVVLAAAAMGAVLYGLRQTARARVSAGEGSGAQRAASGGSAAGAQTEEKDDDPNQVDTIVLGDPGDAPAPARKGDHVSPVHATIVVHLPRFGEGTGLIPDSGAGRLLYGWLAAFNKGSESGLAEALPSPASRAVVAAEMELRRQTGGYALLSAREVEPGLLVFRLRDQTPTAGEALGTLAVRAGSSPATVGSFGLRTVAAPGAGDGAGAEQVPTPR